jgi:hypothetical protein
MPLHPADQLPAFGNPTPIGVRNPKLGSRSAADAEAEHIYAPRMNSRPLQGVWITTRGVYAAAPCRSAPRIRKPDADRSQKSKTEEPIPGQDSRAPSGVVECRPGHSAQLHRCRSAVTEDSLALECRTQ